MCRGSRLVATAACGSPAFGQYRPSGPDGRHEPWALIVLEVVAERIVALNYFLDTGTLFPRFNLPAQLPVAAKFFSATIRISRRLAARPAA
jgi:RNA polymerase sigma-70 factor (ECF subfamily)